MTLFSEGHHAYSAVVGGESEPRELSNAFDLLLGEAEPKIRGLS